MRAAGIKQSRTALFITKQDEVFAQDTDFGRRGGCVGCEGYWLPVSAHPLAARCAWSDLGYEWVVGSSLHAVSCTDIDCRTGVLIRMVMDVVHGMLLYVK